MEQRFFICEHCGNIVAMVRDAGVPVMCCGQKMREIIPGTTEAAAEKLKGVQVKIPARSGANGKLFGAVTSKEVSDALLAQHGIELGKQKIVMDEPIKAYGSYQLKAKLGFEVTGTIYVLVTEEK